MIKLGMQGRKWEIFESAIYLFAQHGYENVSMREIAAKNNLQAASLYNHFPSKGTLLDLMYDFYVVNIKATESGLEEILNMIPNHNPSEIMHRFVPIFSDDLQPLMDCIYLVAITQANRDPKAFDVIWKVNFDHAKQYVSIVLKKMIDLGKIEPLDINAFMNLFSSFCFTAIFRNRSTNPIGMESWVSGLTMLFSIIKEIPQGP